MTQRSPNPRPTYAVRPIRTPSNPRDNLRLVRGFRGDPRQRPASLPRSRVANLPSRERIDSASLEASPRQKGQATRLPTCPPYGGIKCQQLRHSTGVRRRQAAILHSNSAWSPIRQLESLLSHPRRCGNLRRPVRTCLALLPPLCYQLPVLPHVHSLPRNPRSAWADPRTRPEP